MGLGLQDELIPSCAVKVKGEDHSDITSQDVFRGIPSEIQPTKILQ